VKKGPLGGENAIADIVEEREREREREREEE